MGKYYISQSKFTPFTYEQLYNQAANATKAHHEQEDKLGALDAAANNVLAYIDKDKDPDYYQAILNYKQGLNKAAGELSSRGLNGNTYNNVIKLAGAYSGQIKPIEESVARYKEGQTAYNKMAMEHPEFVPIKTWNSYKVSDFKNGMPDMSGINANAYEQDITANLQKLFSEDMKLRKFTGGSVPGYIFRQLQSGLSADQVVSLFANSIDAESAQKMLDAINTVNEKYGVDRLTESNPEGLNILNGYKNDGIIKAIQAPELKQFNDFYGQAYSQYSAKARAQAAFTPQQPTMNNVTFATGIGTQTGTAKNIGAVVSRGVNPDSYNSIRNSMKGSTPLYRNGNKNSAYDKTTMQSIAKSLELPEDFFAHSYNYNITDWAKHYAKKNHTSYQNVVNKVTQAYDLAAAKVMQSTVNTGAPTYASNDASAFRNYILRHPDKITCIASDNKKFKEGTVLSASDIKDNDQFDVMVSPTVLGDVMGKSRTDKGFILRITNKDEKGNDITSDFLVPFSIMPSQVLTNIQKDPNTGEIIDYGLQGFYNLSHPNQVKGTDVSSSLDKFYNEYYSTISSIFNNYANNALNIVMQDIRGPFHEGKKESKVDLNYEENE